MATKAKTKANRTAERKSSRSHTASRSKERQQAARNAFDVLEEDYREVEEWFDEYDELKYSDEDRKADLAEKICLALKVHAQIEEEIFYPRAREASQDNDLIDEALVEHSTVKNLIAEIEGRWRSARNSTKPRFASLARWSSSISKKKRSSCSRSSNRQRWISTRSARNSPSARKS